MPLYKQASETQETTASASERNRGAGDESKVAEENEDSEVGVALHYVGTIANVF